MTDFDFLARLRRLEAACDKLTDRVSTLESDAKPKIKQERDYSPSMEECYGAMIHAMTPREDRKD